MQPGLPISHAHPTAHDHLERLSGCKKFLYGGREGRKEIKEESFIAVIAPCYLTNHWRIIICEKYIYIKDPSLAAMPATLTVKGGTGWEMEWETMRFWFVLRGTVKNFRWCLTYIFRWEMSWGLKVAQKCIGSFLLHFTENINRSEGKQGSFWARPIHS